MGEGELAGPWEANTFSVLGSIGAILVGFVLLSQFHFEGFVVRGFGSVLNADSILVRGRDFWGKNLVVSEGRRRRWRRS